MKNNGFCAWTFKLFKNKLTKIDYLFHHWKEKKKRYICSHMPEISSAKS